MTAVTAGSHAESSLLAELRVATSEAHADLDRALGLVAEDVDRTRYLAFLQGSLAAVRVVEPILDAWLPARPPSRRMALERDLRAVGGEDALAAVPDASDAARPVATIDEAYGAAYVLEGSTLGGLSLARTLAPRLGIDRSAGASYLLLRGEATGAAWRAFLAELESHGATTDAEGRGRSCAAARATFDLYTRAFRASRAFRDA